MGTHAHPFQVIVHRIVVEPRDARVCAHVGMSERPANLVIRESFAFKTDPPPIVQRDGGRRARGEHVAKRICTRKSR